ncbi:hypothetical protein [Streptomyces sp. NPDC060187]|uniref:hypothetical protein n=1 Tax=Streptomyces sp. NPDC060187 TaxID=3347067 RepID=UPI00365B4AFB
MPEESATWTGHGPAGTRVGRLEHQLVSCQDVLGRADSEEPRVLPVEAIELDAFRRLHVHDTFWCGLLLGGGGGQPTTKLYTDRACHFAHHPDPDGLPHECLRHARGVASADHLYVKSAAADWLRGRGEDARFTFAQPAGARLGSIVDIHFKERDLRVHLDPSTPPEWDEDHEPVLGLLPSSSADGSPWRSSARPPAPRAPGPWSTSAKPSSSAATSAAGRGSGTRQNHSVSLHLSDALRPNE